MRPLSLLLAATASVGACSGFIPSRMNSLPDARSTPASPRGRLDMSIPNALDTLTSGLASICRLPFGVTVSAPNLQASSEEKTTPTLLKLFDVEASPACRAVRERITELDLVVDKVIPAAKNSRVFLDTAYEHYLPNEDIEIPRLVVKEGGEERTFMGETDVVSFLNERFATPARTDAEGDKEIKEIAMDVLTTVGGLLASGLRLGRGSSVSPAASADNPSVPRPAKPLVLYSYEGNQFCRLVREVLTELDIVYELRSAGKESPRRAELAEITGGSSQCPFLLDPNTNMQMAESADIIRYLYKTYALWTPPNELLQLASNVLLPWFKPLFSWESFVQAGSLQADKGDYEAALEQAMAEIRNEITQDAVVMYTYQLSPFSSEAKALLENLDMHYTEISLGLEWIPFLIAEGGSAKRAALLEMTGQSSLPHVFIGGNSIGGLFSGTPGLVPALEQGSLKKMVEVAKKTGTSQPAETSDLAEVNEFE